jgi:hypothetical protein
MVRKSFSKRYYVGGWQLKMGILVAFENALRRHWGGLVTVGAIIGLLAYERPRHHVPAFIYWVVAIVATSYLTWLGAEWKFIKGASRPGFDHDLVEVPKYAYVYVEQVIGEYESLRGAASSPSDHRASQIIEKYRSDGNTTWGQLYGLERLLVQLETIEAVRARIIPLRARYASLIGAAGPPLPPFDTAKADEGGHLLTAYVESALREVYRLLAVTACRERLRKRRLQYVGIIGLIALIVLLILTGVLGNLDFRDWAWLVPVPLVGALGGLISSQRRVQSIPSVGESLTDMTNLHFFGSSLTVSALSGAIFAAILYTLFASGLLRGNLFPAKVEELPCMPPKELATLLIWCFVAGFAERFVPDALDRLVSRTAKES